MKKNIHSPTSDSDSESDISWNTPSFHSRSPSYSPLSSFHSSRSSSRSSSPTSELEIPSPLPISKWNDFAVEIGGLKFAVHKTTESKGKFCPYHVAHDMRHDTEKMMADGLNNSQNTSNTEITLELEIPNELFILAQNNPIQ